MTPSLTVHEHTHVGLLKYDVSLCCPFFMTPDNNIIFNIIFFTFKMIHKHDKTCFMCTITLIVEGSGKKTPMPHLVDDGVLHRLYLCHQNFIVLAEIGYELHHGCPPVQLISQVSITQLRQRSKYSLSQQAVHTNRDTTWTEYDPPTRFLQTCT